MYGMRKLDDEDPALQCSPLVMAIMKTLRYTQQHGQIGLTKSGYFKRSFVHWAAAEFNWPGLSEKELFRFNKVLNENDFQPLIYIHGLMIHLRMARHIKGYFKLTKLGASMSERPGKIFALVAEPYLFGVDHLHTLRDQNRRPVDWANVLNILNIESETGITCGRARNLFYGPHDPADGYDQSFAEMELSILKPLMWLGLLQQYDHPDLLRWADTEFIKTPLWRSAMSLPTDQMVVPVTLN